MMDDRVITVFNQIKKLPELSNYSGFGYCGYLSKLLSNKLTKINIKHSILIGEYLSNSEQAIKCKKYLYKLIESIPDDDKTIYGDIKNHFKKRNKRLPNRMGHAVILINDDIYDVTSGQFNLPSFYKLELFKEIWLTCFTCDILIDELSIDSFKIKSVKKMKVIL